MEEETEQSRACRDQQVQLVLERSRRCCAEQYVPYYAAT
jgi:hypothetical protein